MHPQPLSRIFGLWHIDFTRRLPTVESGNRCVVVTIDATTVGLVVAAATDATAKTVAKSVHDDTFIHYGTSEELFTDGEGSSTGSSIGDCLKRLGTKRTPISAYHPQTNSAAERYNQRLGGILAKLCRGAVGK